MGKNLFGHNFNKIVAFSSNDFSVTLSNIEWMELNGQTLDRKLYWSDLVSVSVWSLQQTVPNVVPYLRKYI